MNKKKHYEKRDSNITNIDVGTTSSPESKSMNEQIKKHGKNKAKTNRKQEQMKRHTEIKE